MSSVPPYRPEPSIKLICQAIESYGVDCSETLVKAGLEFMDAKGGKGDKGEITAHRDITSVDLDRMASLAVESSGDPAFGLRLARYVGPATFHALGLSLMTSPTLRDFCLLQAKYLGKLTNSFGEYRELDTIAFLSNEPAPNKFSAASYRVYVDSGFATWLKFIRLIYMPDYVPEKLEFSYPANEKTRRDYENYFGCNATFSAPTNAFYISLQDLDVPLPGGNSELLMLNERMILKLADESDRTDIRSAVAGKIIYLLSLGECSKENVAESIGLSCRTLANRLKQVDTSYQDILTQVRKDLAAKYLVSTDYNLTKIGYLLGFSDPANFTRAFKQWTGCLPSEYRDLNREMYS